jgi:hypothetical protein
VAQEVRGVDGGGGDRSEEVLFLGEGRSFLDRSSSDEFEFI